MSCFSELCHIHITNIVSMYVLVSNSMGLLFIEGAKQPAVDPLMQPSCGPS